jgi:hydroxymethylglutaryl-CoA synthase
VQKLGIDSIGFYTARHYMDLSTLAVARDLDPNKYHIGLGQYTMSIPAPNEDVISMGAAAGARALKNIDKKTISTVIFATESGIDQSKAGAIYIHRLLNLPPHCRAIEFKQACYGSTAGLIMALPMLLANPDQKILLIASDTARYGLNTPGESSQGCGAIAMVLSVNPRLVSIDLRTGYYTQDIMDFWRPNYRDEAFVEGKYSSRMYLQGLNETWSHYQAATELGFQDHDRFCYHTPVPKLTEKAHKYLAKHCKVTLNPEKSNAHIFDSLIYGRLIGNTYTASLFVCLVSLLDNCPDDLSGERIGFYSYGSGCVAEFFNGTVSPQYRDHLDTDFNKSMLQTRLPLTYSQYQEFYNFTLPVDGSTVEIPALAKCDYHFTRLSEHKRCYEGEHEPVE